MHVHFALLADSATVRPDGRLDATAIGPFTVHAKQFPVIVPEFAVVTRVGFDVEEDAPGQLVVRIVAPNGAVVAERDSEVEIPPVFAAHTGERTRTRVLNFFRVSLPIPGSYHVHVKLNGVDYLTRIYFDVEQVVAAAHEAGSSAGARTQ